MRFLPISQDRFESMGVGNLRHKWYVDRTACMEFSHRDVNNQNSIIFVMLISLTLRLTEPRVIVASLRNPLTGSKFHSFEGVFEDDISQTS